MFGHFESTGGERSPLFRAAFPVLPGCLPLGTHLSHQHASQALNDLHAAVPWTLFLKAQLLMHFTDCIYRLPPFLHHIDIRDLSLTNEEKVLLLMKPSSTDPDEAEGGEKETLKRREEEEEEWMIKLRPIQFFRYRFRDAAPRMETLLPTFLHALHHHRIMTDIVWPALKQLPGSIVCCERSPGRHSSLLSVQLPGSFQGKMRIETDRIYLTGAFMKHHPPFRVPELSIQPDQLLQVLKELID